MAFIGQNGALLGLVLSLCFPHTALCSRLIRGQMEKSMFTKCLLYVQMAAPVLNLPFFYSPAHLYRYEQLLP